jgi:hypothetical protein
VVSTDGLIGKEAKTLLKNLPSLSAEKWEKPYSVVCGYEQMLLAMPLPFSFRFMIDRILYA